MSRRPGGWQMLVPVVALSAGLLFVTSARTAHGTNLRSEQTNLPELVRSAQVKNVAEQGRVTALQDEVAAFTDRLAKNDSVVTQISQRAAPLRVPAGLTGVHGPGLEVTLNDSKQPQTDPSVGPNDLVVHQSDMQAVVNALWAGGAEAMTLMGQRLIATSAVRCVGNTLLLNGQVFSPPFTVSAIGPAQTMRAALDRSPDVALYREAARDFGLGYSVTTRNDLVLGAYDAPIGLNYAATGTRP